MTFNSAEEVEDASLQVLRGISEKALQEQVNKLLEHCQEDIRVGGHYVTD